MKAVVHKGLSVPTPPSGAATATSTVRSTFQVATDSDGPGWILTRDGHDIGSFMLRHDAVTRARAQAVAAKPSRVIVMTRDGAVETDRLYGSDQP